MAHPPSDLDWLQVRRYCLREARRHAARPSDAEDIAQNATLRAWCARHTLRDQEALWSWLSQITRNEAMRMYERKRPECMAELPESVDEESLADRVAASLDLRRALALLPDVDRQLVALHYGRDLTCQIAAARLDLALPTAKVRLHRVRRRLAKALESGNQ